MKRISIILTVSLLIISLAACSKDPNKQYYGTYVLTGLEADSGYTQQDKDNVFNAHKGMTVILDKNGAKISRDGSEYYDVTYTLNDKGEGLFKDSYDEIPFFFKDGKMYFDGIPLAVFFILEKK